MIKADEEEARVTSHAGNAPFSQEEFISNYVDLEENRPFATVVPPPNDATMCRYCWKRTCEPLIAPCRNCVTFYVHRSCLDSHRVNIYDPQRLVRCESCEGDFTLLPNQQFMLSRRARFHAYVIRDFFVFFCVLQAVLLVLGMLMRALDQAIAFCVPFCQPDGRNVDNTTCVVCPPIKNTFFPRSLSEDHERFTYYTCGLIVFLAGVGMFGACHACWTSKTVQGSGYVAPQPLPDRDLDLCICCCPHSNHHRGGNTCLCDCAGDCCCRVGCGNCDCKGDSSSNSGGELVFVIFLVVCLIIICFAFVGLFYGIVLATALFQRVVQRHLHLLDLREIAKEYPVADLATPLDQDIPYAEVVREVRELL